ncbi:MAG: 50S ribosomal protein L18 [Candidatus Omnitrophota bacterium]|nr:50S ribosomal protein L18 [Candidatus Omnitrophota bacterium]
MDNKKSRERRKKSIRKKISGSSERPRMCLHKSNRNIYIQIVNDVDGKTLCGVSTNSPDVKNKVKAYTRKNVKFAEIVAEAIARKAGEKGIKRIVFDRSGYQYHGVVKTVADTARKNGLEF